MYCIIVSCLSEEVLGEPLYNPFRDRATPPPHLWNPIEALSVSIGQSSCCQLRGEADNTCIHYALFIKIELLFTQEYPKNPQFTSLGFSPGRSSHISEAVSPLSKTDRLIWITGFRFSCSKRNKIEKNGKNERENKV